MSRVLLFCVFLARALVFAAAPPVCEAPAQQDSAPEAPAQPAAPRAEAAKCVVFATRQCGNLDFIAKVPPNRAVIHSVSSVYKNENLLVCPALANVAAPDGKYDIEFSFKMAAPDGKISDFAKSKRISGRLGGAREILWPIGGMGIMFEASDPSGEYKFEFLAKNMANGEVVRGELALAVADFPRSTAAPIAGKKDFDDAFKNYNSTFSPETLRNLFASEHGAIVRENGSLNYAAFSFFREAFRQKPFLLGVLADEFDTATDSLRRNTIILFASLGENARLAGKVMTQAERALFDNAFNIVVSIKSPYEPETGIGAQDMLWGEFFARGNYAPIERIFAYLSDYKSAREFVDMVKGGAKFGDFDKSRAVKDARFLAAAFSLSRNLRLPLAAAYADFYLIENKGKFTAQNLKDAFALLREYSEFQIQKRKAAESAAAQAGAPEAAPAQKR